MPALAYLDNNATSPVSERALARLEEVCRRFPGNPSSPHLLGRRARDVLEESRASVGACFGRPAGVVFTSGGTEANVLCLLGTLRHPESRIEQLVVSELEHGSVHGVLEQTLPVPASACRATKEGLPDLDHLESLVRGRRTLVSMMHVNNETGAVFPLAEIAAIVRRHGGLLHSDAAQSAGKVPLARVAGLCDALTFSAHKFNGPLGAGGIVVMNREFRLAPISPGGLQEGGVRSGTVNLPAVAGAAEALAESLEDGRPEAELAAWRARLEGFLRAQATHCLVAAAAAPRLWTTSYVCFPGLDQDDLVRELSDRGVCAAEGSACSRRLGGSRVLEKMGIDGIHRQGGVRFSVSRRTAQAELDLFHEVFPGAYSAAMARSPYVP